MQLPRQQNDSKLHIEYHFKNILQNLDEENKTKKSIRLQIPKQTLEFLLNSIVLSCLDYSAIIIIEGKKILIFLLKRQSNCGLKKKVFRSE